TLPSINGVVAPWSLETINKNISGKKAVDNVTVKEISKEGLEFLEKAEGGFHPKVYNAKTGKTAKFDKKGKIIGSGDWTIGYGHKLTEKEISNKTYKKTGITQKEAETLLLKDAQHAIERINNLSKVNLSQKEFDALVSFAFQQGI